MEDENSLIGCVYQQGIEAAHEVDPSPLRCPWSPEMHEEALAWFAGYSLGAMTRGRRQVAAGIIRFD